MKILKYLNKQVLYLLKWNSQEERVMKKLEEMQANIQTAMQGMGQ